MNITTETDRDRIVRLAADGWIPARILAALGHPGYSNRYARRVLDTLTRLQAHDLTVGDIIHNSRAYRAALFAESDPCG